MSITLQLNGLHCNHCVKSVENTLKAIDGVTAVQVSLDPQQAIVEGDVNPAVLVAAIDDIGFEAKAA